MYKIWGEKIATHLTTYLSTIPVTDIESALHAQRIVKVIEITLQEKRTPLIGGMLLIARTASVLRSLPIPQR